MEVTPGDVPVVAGKKCAMCPKLVPAGEPWKNCPNCREKSRLAYKKRQDRKRTLKVLEANGKHESASAVYAAANGNGISRAIAEVGPRIVPAYPTKAPPLPHQQPGNGNFIQEFQTATQMYEMLKKMYQLYKMAGRSTDNNNKSNNTFQFRGCFSIIAKTGVDHSDRVRIVAEDLRRVANLHFKTVARICNTGKSIFGCLCYKEVLKQSTSTSTSTNRVDESPNPKCHGMVVVTAGPDNSHPLGIKGEKIIVIIRHP